MEIKCLMEKKQRCCPIRQSYKQWWQVITNLSHKFELKIDGKSKSEDTLSIF